jgi:hypothetical protein
VASKWLEISGTLHERKWNLCGGPSIAGKNHGNVITE